MKKNKRYQIKRKKKSFLQFFQLIKTFTVGLFHFTYKILKQFFFKSDMLPTYYPLYEFVFQILIVFKLFYQAIKNSLENYKLKKINS